MKSIQRLGILIISLLMVLIPFESFAEINKITSMSSAINKAGRQRMLSQRIVATYCQVGMDIKSVKSKKELKKAVRLFDEQLAALKAYRPTGQIHHQLNLVTEYWEPMKAVALGPISREKATQLWDMADDVLRASHRAVIMLQDESASQSGRLVNVSGRQRMLSQRMSNLYMLQSWGFGSSEYSSAYSQAINEFKGALGELRQSPLNTSVIDKQLQKARKQFAMLERSLIQKDGEFIPLMVTLSADKLLVIMNDITHLYEKLES